MIEVDKAKIARYKGFEIFVDSDKALQFRKSELDDIREVLAVETIFSDAKKALEASHSELKNVFSTEDPLEVAKIIVAKGDVPVSAEHRQHEIEQKRKQIIYLIHRNAVDPKTHTPIPVSRIENAFEIQSIKVDAKKDANQQMQDILQKIREVIPIKFETKQIEIMMTAEYATKSYPIIASFGRKLKEDWLSSGAYKALVEIPGGMEQDFYDKLNSLTHGNVQTKVINMK